MKHYRFIVYTNVDGREVILFKRRRYCTEEVADMYVNKLLERYRWQYTGAGWEVIP